MFFFVTKMQFSIIWFSIHLFLRDVTQKIFHLYCIRVFLFSFFPSYVCRIIIIKLQVEWYGRCRILPSRKGKKRRNLRANRNWMKIYPTQKCIYFYQTFKRHCLLAYTFWYINSCALLCLYFTRFLWLFVISCETIMLFECRFLGFGAVYQAIYTVLWISNCKIHVT